jgi:hypothetical protein
MKVLHIIDERNFTVVLECEHCLARERHEYYDETHFPSKAVPEMECKACGLPSPDGVRV